MRIDPSFGRVLARRIRRMFAGGPGSGWTTEEGHISHAGLKLKKFHTEKTKFIPVHTKSVMHQMMIKKLHAHGFEYTHTDEKGVDYYAHPLKFKGKDDFIRLRKSGFYGGATNGVAGDKTSELENYLVSKNSGATPVAKPVEKPVVPKADALTPETAKQLLISKGYKNVPGQFSTQPGLFQGPDGSHVVLGDKSWDEVSEHGEILTEDNPYDNGSLQKHLASKPVKEYAAPTNAHLSKIKEVAQAHGFMQNSGDANQFKHNLNNEYGFGSENSKGSIYHTGGGKWEHYKAGKLLKSGDGAQALENHLSPLGAKESPEDVAKANGFTHTSSVATYNTYDHPTHGHLLVGGDGFWEHYDKSGKLVETDTGASTLKNHLSALTSKPVEKPGIKVLDTKVSGAKGSNEGGVYKGSDGVERYVKFYANSEQGKNEVLANKIYNALGLSAPESEVHTEDGKMLVASKMLKDPKQMNELGEGQQKILAQNVMKGFAADVLVNNWDTVGLDLDNIVYSEGKIYRIDNGGALLFRAKGALKPAADLNKINEWDKLMSPSTNPAYTKIAKLAGVSSPLEIENIKEQVAQIKAVRDANGGWHNFVKKNAPSMSAEDQKKIGDMLEARTNLMLQKVELAPVPKNELEDLLVNKHGFTKKTVYGFTSYEKPVDGDQYKEGAHKVVIGSGDYWSLETRTESGDTHGQHGEGKDALDQAIQKKDNALKNKPKFEPIHAFTKEAVKSKVADLMQKYPSKNNQYNESSIYTWANDFDTSEDKTAAGLIKAAEGKGLYPELAAHFGIKPQEMQKQLKSDVESWAGASADKIRESIREAVVEGPNAQKPKILEYEITQYKLNKMHPSGMITLHRGLKTSGGSYGEHAVNAVKFLQSIAGVVGSPESVTKLSTFLQQVPGAQTSGYVKDFNYTLQHSLSKSGAPETNLDWSLKLKSGGAESWSASSSVASGFKGSGVAVTQKIPISHIWTANSINSGLGLVSSEDEYIVAPPDGYYLHEKKTTNLKAAVMRPEHVALIFLGKIKPPKGIIIDRATKTITVDLSLFDPNGTGSNWGKRPSKLKAMSAGGPGSGRHKELGTLEKPLIKKPLLQKPLRDDDTERKLAIQRKKTKALYKQNMKQGKSAKGRPILTDKQKRAVANTVAATKEHQDRAEEVERLIAKHINGHQSPDNKAFDVTKSSADGKRTHAIEVKALLMQKNDKITMSKGALQRKHDFLKKNKNHTAHTLAVDLRGKTPVVYHRPSIGSFRIGSMQKVEGGLKGLHKLFV